MKRCGLRELQKKNICNCALEYKKNYLLWFFIGVGKIVIAAFVFYNHALAVLFMSPYLYVYLKERKKDWEFKRKKRLNLQFKDAMEAVTFSLNVGYSMENAFKEALIELRLLYGDEGEIVKVFQNIVRRVEHNENIETALYDFAQASRVEDIIYFAEVFRYAKRSGGDLISIIKNTASTIREKIEIKEEIETVISGKKMEQKVMSAMPMGIILYLRLTAPEFIQPLYGTLSGVITMTFCLLVYLAADSVAKRIVNINV